MTKITVDKDLIEQAIEALTKSVWFCNHMGVGDWQPTAMACHSGIAALRAALAEPAVEPVAYRSLLASGSYTYCITKCFFDNAEPLYTAPQPPAEPAHKPIYPGGGKSLFDKLWHLTCNAVATQSGMRVRTDVLPMIELREFLHHLCVVVDSPPSAPQAQQVAEPAAYRYKYLNFMGDEVWSQDMPRNGKALETQALYTSPPPPAEVPLLDDKGILCMWHETADRVPMCEHYKHFARAVEQAVRQKAGL